MATDVGTLQGKLELDMSDFNKAMNKAINLVRDFGQQLQGALGSSAIQGFSATNQAVQTLAAEMQSLVTNAQNLVNTLGQVNTQILGFLNTMQTSSSLGANMNTAAQSAQNTANATGQAANNTQQAANSTNQLNQNMSGASRNASRTAQNTNSAASGANRAANNAKKMSNNIHTASTFAANLKHILEGIVISQSFYRLLGIMQDLVSNANQFMMYMEQSSIGFKYLLGSAENAQGMLQALQDFAVSSPLDMQGATQASRMLMTMGFQAESTIGVLRILTDAATVAGGEMEGTVNRLSLALGQMLQSGTVKAQEVRQLVNANIPIYEILQEELGLTAKQVANIGKESVNSATAVNAILRGLQKRFGGASKEMQQTLTGALSACKDSFYVLYNIMMQSPFGALRDKVVALSETLQQLVQIARNAGIGGVFEAIVPKWLQPYIRNIIGALGQFGYALRYAAAVVKDIFGAAFAELAYVFSLILPPINIFLNAILQLTHYLLQTYPVVRYVIGAFLAFSILTKLGAILMWFWKIMGLGKICLLIANYVGILMKALAALSVIMTSFHGIPLIFTVIVAGALYATGALQKLIGKFKELLSFIGVKWANMNKTINKGLNIGYDPNKILQPTTNKDNQLNAEKYNGALQDISNSLEDVGNEADKTGKKLKQNFNQSFDEVYTINPNQDVANDLGLGGLGNLDLSEPIGQLGDFNDALNDLDGFDLGGWDQDFMDQWDQIWGNIKSYLHSFGLGALLAGILTTLLTGNPWLGLAAALAALFWPAIAEKLNLTKAEGQTILGAAIGGLLGAVIAKIAGVGLLKGALWSGIGALIFAGLWPAIQEYIDSGDWQAALRALNFTFFGSGIGALIGNLIRGPLGAALGVVVGACIGKGIEGGIDAWANGENGWQIANACNWTLIGTGLGTAIGGFIYGPLGAAIGAVIGGLVGFIADKIAEVLAAIDGDWSIAGEAFKAWGKAIKDAFIDGLLGDGGLFGWTTEIISWAGEFFSDISDAVAQQDWLRVGKDILLGVLNGLLGAIVFIFEPIARIFNAIIQAFCEIFGIHSPATEMEPVGQNILLGILEGIIKAVIFLPAYIAEAGAAVIAAIAEWFVDIGENVTEWLSGAVTSLNDFVTKTGVSFKNWVTERVNDFITFTTNTKEKINTWTSKTSENFRTWVNTNKEKIHSWAADTKGKIASWSSETQSRFNNWVSTNLNKITTWWSGTKAKFDAFKSVSFSSWCSNTLSTISNWASNLYSTISSKIGSAISKVKEFLNLSSSSGNINVNVSGSSRSKGHATGGVFDREHFARFAEGNKAEAVIPLENASAMQPFVDAVSNGLTASLAPIMASMNTGDNNLPPVYVGALIADERGLKELERKMRIIRIKEERRG